jgi:secreted trypsin-like serine protease
VVALINSSALNSGLFLGQFCGAIPTGDNQIITAEHCVAHRTAETVDVVGGVKDLCADAQPSMTRGHVTKIEHHVGPGGTLAVLTVDTNFEAAPEAGKYSPQPDDFALAYGWGRASVAGVPRCELRAVELSMVSSHECNALVVSFDIDPTDVLCTVPAHTENSCDGDSGGPVLVVREGKVVAVGVTISGEGCGPTDVGFNALLEQKTPTKEPD